MDPDTVVQWMLVGFAGIMMVIAVFCFIMLVITTWKLGKRK